MILFLFFTLASCLENFDTYNVAGAYRFDDDRVCHLYERNLEIYLQLEDVRTTELSTPYSIAQSSLSCPEVPQLCFKFDGYSYAFTRNRCTNVTRVVKGPTQVFRFKLWYDLLRYDYSHSKIYILRKPTLFGCRFSRFLRENFTCASAERENVSWDDFLISNNMLLYLVNHTVYTGFNSALMQSDVIPYSLFPLHNNLTITPFLILGYLVELIFLLILLYCFNLQKKKKKRPSLLREMSIKEPHITLV